MPSQHVTSINGLSIKAALADNATNATNATNANNLNNKPASVYAITGSNTFIGSQTITGSVAITGSLTLIGNLSASGLDTLNKKLYDLNNQLTIDYAGNVGYNSSLILGKYSYLNNDPAGGFALSAGGSLRMFATNSAQISVLDDAYVFHMNLGGYNTHAGNHIALYAPATVVSGSRGLYVQGPQQITGSLSISGSATFNNIITLTPRHPLPSGMATGSFMVSASVPPKPYFYDGTTWFALY